MAFYDDIQLLAGGTGIREKKTIRLVNRDYYCLQYNHDGRIQVRIDEGPIQDVQGPSILITYPGATFAFGTDGSTSWHHNYVSFTGPRVKKYIASGFLPVDKPIQYVLAGNDLLSAFEECVAYTKSGQRARAAHALEAILLLLQDQASPRSADDTASRQKIQDLTTRIRANPTHEYPFEIEAKEANLSEAHLRRLFKQITGHPPGQYLILQRLAFAANALANTDEPLKNIALDARLGSLHYFTRLFKRRYQIPPARFRQNIRGLKSTRSPS